ncbi:uncharacterized protein sp100.1 isoform 2-T2 [Clarias gariepinus]|uniref:nuclear body protein SP140-like protein isoform X2 n=1 Tax=Clarias gariepinus TaxID=13013 RepID=UPI00234D363A|nr:nuclear body protein SP140-like protein isoform X2 [Clarias gariepinus]
MSPKVTMNPLDFLTEDEMLKFFHCKKTEISCIEEPQTFLNQLRDFNLVPENLYRKVLRMKSNKRRQEGVYEILDLVESKQAHKIKVFWSCVFHDHIMQKYPAFRLLRNSLLDGSFRFYENLPNAEEPNNMEKEPVRKEKKDVKPKKGEKRKKSVEESEEEEKEEEEAGPSSCSTPKTKKPTRKPTFSSPLKKGEKAPIWTWDLYKTTLPVTCGNEEATLNRAKLAKGEKSILCNGKWFTPSGFEKVAGKGSCKNWRTSIRCQNVPLQKLILEDHLQCPRMKRRCVQKSRRVLFRSSPSESSSPQSESSVEMEGSNEDQEEEEREKEGEQEVNNEEEEEDEEDQSEPVDLSVFEGAVLPVSCGSVTGDLYKKRFSGPRSKSIRTEERWFSPEDFVKQESALTHGRWKRDILCHGRPLYFLVKKEILYIHSLLCDCYWCLPDDPLDQNNDDVCFICDLPDDKDRDLVCCDECPCAFHQDCHVPTPQHNTEKWLCTFCIWKINHPMWIPMSLEEALNSSVIRNMMRCEYLLLCLYKEDKQRVFTDDPFTTVPGYDSVISNPMWLDKVKIKLEKKNYSMVGEFVHDIRLIFQNCQSFNRDDDIGTTGARLSEIFEERFLTAFKIQ